MIAPPPAEAEPEYRTRLGVSGGIALATGPGWAPSLALDAGVRWRDRPLSVAFEVGVVPPASGDVTSGGHVVDETTYRITGAGVACGHFARFLFACGVVEAGALHGTPAAMMLNGHPVTVFYMGAGGRGGAEFPFNRYVAVRVAADAVVAIARPVLEIGGTPIYQASLVSGSATGGLVFSF